MDMISAIELEDALKTKDLVENRIREVALKIAKINGEIDGNDSRVWTVENYYVNTNEHVGEDRWREKSEVTVMLQVDWCNRPKTVKFGDPEYDEENEYSQENPISRRVWFPRRYLFTDGWEQEVIDIAALVKARRDELHLESLNKALGETDKRKNDLLSKKKEIEDRLAVRN